MHFMVKRSFIGFFRLLTVLMILSSCSEQKRTWVRNYPKNTPFVYNNQITLHGNFTKDEKKRLLSDLQNYWDDSLKVPKQQQFGLFYKIKNPAVFDSTNINRSALFMNSYLNAQGYYYSVLTNNYTIDTVKDQIRASVFMDIDAGKNITIDQVSYEMNDSTLQQIAVAEAGKSYLKKSNPYSKQVISNELDRMVGLYRKNGYYKITREDVYAYVDSNNTKLFALTIDPFEQAKLLSEVAKAKKENPNWDIAIRQREVEDSSRILKYHIGNLYYYPETKITDVPDSLITDKTFFEKKSESTFMRYKKGLFSFRPLKEDTYFKKGDVYNEEKYFKTANALGQLSAWQNIDIRPEIRNRDTLDMYFFMTPAVKQSFTVDLEASRNIADIGVTNLLGITTNLSYNNRNVWKNAIQSIATFRTGVELNILSSSNEADQLLQTFLINIGHTYIFPGIIQPFKRWKGLDKIDNRRTLWSVNGGYVDRRNFYRVRNLTTSFGYEWKKGNNSFLYKPINVELYSIDKLDSLDQLIIKNPFLKASFNEGSIVSQSLSFVRTTNGSKNPNKNKFYRLAVEEAGGLFGFIPGLQGNIYRYLKVETEYKQSVKFAKSELAYRAFAGIGYNYGGDTIIGPTLPFYKQFSAGGPNSMRAWRLRQLGLGSSNQSETDTASNAFRDRFGDMQLEFNVEYRFQLATIGSFKIGSALYADIGNVWNIKRAASTDSDTRFSLNSFTRDMAIGIGTGLRFDMSYFLIRLDFAYKLKDPIRSANNGWMSIRDFTWNDIRPNGIKVPNFALQLGIGLPF
ncbi:MAG: BamA/TamA family outer membrane protein [Sediminibacterium sp.]|uniref:BamA/TamA family outer membrane protein n=1 Tax=Sediminibacterium sp. TaxID=1917865 RepID=UPI0027243300|nr:BamA/TamA family outer membrane protein [Sediminibacterium sp.]MDO8997584.1 BamA/TamA family outer membrane protein [Sediminibacterium sp.]